MQLSAPTLPFDPTAVLPAGLGEMAAPAADPAATSETFGSLLSAEMNPLPAPLAEPAAVPGFALLSVATVPTAEPAELAESASAETDSDLLPSAADVPAGSECALPAALVASGQLSLPLAPLPAPAKIAEAVDSSAADSSAATAESTESSPESAAPAAASAAPEPTAPTAPRRSTPGTVAGSRVQAAYRPRSEFQTRASAVPAADATTVPAAETEEPEHLATDALATPDSTQRETSPRSRLNRGGDPVQSPQTTPLSPAESFTAAPAEMPPSVPATAPAREENVATAVTAESEPMGRTPAALPPGTNRTTRERPSPRADFATASSTSPTFAADVGAKRDRAAAAPNLPRDFALAAGPELADSAATPAAPACDFAPSIAPTNAREAVPATTSVAPESDPAAEIVESMANANHVAAPAPAGRMRLPADSAPGVSLLDVTVTGESAPEKIAAASRQISDVVGTLEKCGIKKSVSTDKQVDTDASNHLGILTANSRPDMTALAPTIARSSADDTTPAFTPPVFEVAATATEHAQPTGFEPAAAAARRTVESVLAVTDHFTTGGQHGVNLKFSVGGVDLSVRVEVRGGSVQTTFRTDSPELRGALASEWRSVVAATGDRSPHLADPVFTASSSREESSAGAGGFDQRGSSARQEQPSFGESTAPRVQLRRSAAIPAAAPLPPSAAVAAPGRLHALA